MMEFYEEILKLVESGHSLDTIYLDFSKVFDYTILLKNMYNIIGIEGKIGKWIREFLVCLKEQYWPNKPTNQLSIPYMLNYYPI